MSGCKGVGTDFPDREKTTEREGGTVEFTYRTFAYFGLVRISHAGDLLSGNVPNGILFLRSIIREYNIHHIHTQLRRNNHSVGVM